MYNAVALDVAELNPLRGWKAKNGNGNGSGELLAESVPVIKITPIYNV